VIASAVDGVILVVRMQPNARRPAERARDVLQSVGAHVVGAVVNDIPQRHQLGYGYEYRGYGEDNEVAERPPDPPAQDVVVTTKSDRKSRKDAAL
jgi:Mrp family chromosome partitioning ATPase